MSEHDWTAGFPRIEQLVHGQGGDVFLPARRRPWAIFVLHLEWVCLLRLLHVLSTFIHVLSSFLLFPSRFASFFPTGLLPKGDPLANGMCECCRVLMESSPRELVRIEESRIDS